MSINKKNPYYRNQEPTKLGDALNQMFDAYNIKGKADQTTIITLWEEVLGKTIAARTRKLFFKGDVLYVELTSAPLKQELLLAKPKIIAMLNKNVTENTISDIIFR